MQGIDTTDSMVFGHEAWITTDKNSYAPGDTVSAVLRWGHNMRPDGFCRADEFRIFVTSSKGKKMPLTPKKGEGDWYDISFTVFNEGLYTLTAIYDNSYGRDERDRFFEGTRRDFPEIKEVINYLQIYTTCFVVGECEGVEGSFLPETRLSFVPVEWNPPAKYTVISADLYKDGELLPMEPVMLIYSDGRGYLERVLNSDAHGNLFFMTRDNGTYCMIYRTALDEALPGVYDTRSVTVTFTCVCRGEKTITL